MVVRYVLAIVPAYVVIHHVRPYVRIIAIAVAMGDVRTVVTPAARMAVGPLVTKRAPEVVMRPVTKVVRVIAMGIAKIPVKADVRAAAQMIAMMIRKRRFRVLALDMNY